MKIALIIFRIGPSHGSLLQTYALYHVLKEMGHSVTIVNRKDKLPFKQFIKRLLHRVYRKLSGESVERLVLTEVIPSSIMVELNKFVEKHFSADLRDFSKIKFRQNAYDVFLVGSDQVWRPKFVQDVSYYFLGFAKSLKNIKRISYAASFGVDEWEYSVKDTKKCKELAQLFSAVSVREDSGVDLCKKYLGVDATHVLDPTMLLDEKDYIHLIGDNNDLMQTHTLAYSILDNDTYKKTLINDVSGFLKLSPVSIKSDESNLDYVETGIEFWLDGIRKSSFVITDSFHATVFAIIFNKPFIVLGNKHRGISRLSSLLNMFGLSNRILYEDSYKEWQSIIQQEIKWEIVNERRLLLKSKSLEYLKNSILKAKI